MTTPDSKLSLNIPLRRSKRYGIGLVLLHGIVLIGLVMLSLNIWQSVLGLTVLAVQATWTYRSWNRLAIIDGLIATERSISLVVDGEPLDARFTASTLITPWLTLIHLRTGKTRWTLPLLDDTATPKDLRRLRVWLNCCEQGVRDEKKRVSAHPDVGP